MSVEMNPDWPSGIAPAQGAGGDSQYEVREFTVLGSYNTLIPEGALVQLDQASGGVQVYTSGAVSGKDVLGVSVHKTAASTSDQTIQVYIDPDQIFEGQLDDAVAAADSISDLQGNGTTLVGNASENSTTGRSIAELDASLVGAVSTTNFCIILGAARGVDNEIVAAGGSGRTRVQFKISPAVHIFG